MKSMMNSNSKTAWHSITSGTAARVTSGEAAAVELSPGLWLRRGPSGFEVGIVLRGKSSRSHHMRSMVTAASHAVMGMALEAGVVVAACEQIDEGVPLDDDDRARLVLARKRALAARQLIMDVGVGDVA